MPRGTKRVKGRTVPAKGFRFVKGGRGRVVKTRKKATRKRRRSTSRRRRR